MNRDVIAAVGTDANGPETSCDSDLARWERAIRIQVERPRWVVIWLARAGQYRAYPRFRPPAGMTFASGVHSEELIAEMDRMEAAAQRKGRSAGAQPT